MASSPVVGGTEEGLEFPPQLCGSQKSLMVAFTMWMCYFLALELIVLMGLLTLTQPRMNYLLGVPPRGYSRWVVYQLSLQRSSPPLTVLCFLACKSRRDIVHSFIQANILSCSGDKMSDLH